MLPVLFKTGSRSIVQDIISMPSFTIHHITRYRYNFPVKESVNQLKIFPVENEFQLVKHFDLQISGQPAVEMFTDYFGNRTGDFSVRAPHNELIIDVRMTINTTSSIHGNLSNGTQCRQVFSHIANNVYFLKLAEAEKIEQQSTIDEWLKNLAARDKTVPDATWLCSAFIHQHFEYKKGITTIETTVDDILEHRSGVCQDFAHLLLQMLRTLGIPARYVSGYICPNTSGMRGEGATHAWVECYDPLLGWLGIDPTNQMWTGGHHIKLATGSHFNDCTPVKGTFRGIATQSLSVYVSVGYEDGHVFEEVNEVKMQTAQAAAEAAAWQKDWMQSQQ